MLDWLFDAMIAALPPHVQQGCLALMLLAIAILAVLAIYVFVLT